MNPERMVEDDPPNAVVDLDDFPSHHHGNVTLPLHEDDYDYDLGESFNTYYWDELLPPLTVYVMTLLLGVLGNSLIIYTIFRYDTRML